MIENYSNYTSVRLCPEAYEPSVRQAILEELRGTLGTSISYWSGYPEADDKYMRSIICDLGKEGTPWIQERIFRYLLPASRSFPNRLSVYAKFFFSGIKGAVANNDPTANRLIDRLVELTENNSERARIAALNILKRICENYELISPDKLLLIEQNALSTQRRDIFLQETELPEVLITIVDDYLEPPQIYSDNRLLLDPCQFVAVVREGRIKKGDPIIIETLDGVKLEVNFQGFSNMYYPTWIFYIDNQGGSSSLSLNEIFRVTPLRVAREGADLQEVDQPLPPLGVAAEGAGLQEVDQPLPPLGVAREGAGLQEVDQPLPAAVSPNVLQQQPPPSLPWYLAIPTFIWHRLVSFWNWIIGCFG